MINNKLAESTLILNELYLRNVSKIDDSKVGSVLNNVITKKKPAMQNKYNFVKSIGQLSKEEKIRMERTVPENYSVNDPNTHMTTNYKREIKVVKGVLVALYFDHYKNLGMVFAIVRGKKNNTLAFKRLYWRLHSNKKNVK